MPLSRRPAIFAAVAGLHAAVIGALVLSDSTPGVDQRTTASIAMDGPEEGPARTYLVEALEALEGGDFESLRKLRRNLPEDSLDGRIVDWVAAYSGRAAISSDEIAATMRALEGWPDMSRLRANYERALAREDHSPKEIATAYADTTPQTLAGAISLARASISLDDVESARAALLPWWTTEPLDVRSELQILSEFSEVLTKDDHRRRFLALMYRDRIRAAERVAQSAGMAPFLDPWAAAIRLHKNALELLDEADESVRNSPHLLFAKIKWLRRKERDDEAAKLLLESPVEPDELVDPDEWWTERRIVSRDAFEHGNHEAAYRIASMHRGGSAETQVEAAFHAGWYALRGLKDPKKAAAHFALIEKLSSGAISRARGAYWLGRAYEAMESPEAETHYKRAAELEMTFYGQLARQRLGLNLSGIKRPSVTPDDTSRFRSTEPVAAMQRLQEIGRTDLARKMAYGLGRKLENTPSVTQLVAHWEKMEERFTALRIAKAAQWRGVETGALTHPIGAIPASTPIKPEERPLAYAIARQESEFNVAARSRANALGLMQLLPGTAKEVARQAGLAYQPSRLNSDGAYNATLGTEYLKRQLDRFGGSYILTFIAYNAGPSRVGQWIERFGDPRGKPLDEVVDWVEQIPFTETRGYVQRVMENLQVYKARFGEPTDIASDLRFGWTD